MRRSAMLSNAAALSILVLLAAYPSHAETADEQKPTCVDDAMLVFDASGSMAATDFPEGAPSRMDRVRQALVKVLPAASQTRRLGLMVYGPGRYRFADFLKVGSLLTVLIFIVALLLVPRVWPLK